MSIFRFFYVCWDFQGIDFSCYSESDTAVDFSVFTFFIRVVYRYFDFIHVRWDFQGIVFCCYCESDLCSCANTRSVQQVCFCFVIGDPTDRPPM